MPWFRLMEGPESEALLYDLWQLAARAAIRVSQFRVKVGSLRGLLTFRSSHGSRRSPAKPHAAPQSGALLIRT